MVQVIRGALVGRVDGCRKRLEGKLARG
jgi:hypothetical protein